MSPSDPEYFQEIEAHFIHRRHSPFPILSGKDWALMRKWAEEGVPLPLIIEAIDTVFDKHALSGSEKPISSLSYVRHAVAKLWKERKEMLVGGQEELPEAGAAERLDELASQVEAASPATATRIRELVRLRSVPKIEEGLIELERELIEELTASLSDEERGAIRAEIARAVGDTSRLDEAIRARTEEANLRRFVRERFGVPRLTLFR